MVELMQQISTRQGDISNERYARNFDISGVTLFRWHKGQRKPDVNGIRKMARFYQSIGDAEMVKLLSQYVLFGEE